MTPATGSYLVGLAQALTCIVALLLAATRIRQRLLLEPAGSAGALVVSVIALGLLTFVAVLLGSVGAFSAWPLIAALVAVAIGVRIALPPPGSPSPSVEREWSRSIASLPAGKRVLRGAIVAGSLSIAAIVLARFAVATAGAYGTGMTGFDSTWYHGTFAAMMAQSGSTFELNHIAPQYLSWFYPNGSELLHSLGMVTFERDLLSPGLNLLVMLGCMTACWAIGRAYGLAPLTLAAGAVVLGSGLLADQAGEARNDLLGVFFTLAAAAILLNSAADAGRLRGSPSRSERETDASWPGTGLLFVVGLAAGLAAGVKLNYLATAGALAVATLFLAPAGRRLRGGLVLAVAVIAGGGYWYLRNLVHSGNPLPWITSIGPLELPGPGQEIGGREPHGVIDYALDFSVWAEWFAPGFREALTLLWPVILLGAAVTVVSLLRRGGAERALAAVILATVAGWLGAPASAEGPDGEPVGFVSALRYLAPALVLAWALLPVALASTMRRVGVITGANPHDPEGVSEPDQRSGAGGDSVGAGSGPRLGRRVLISTVVAFALAAVVLGGDRLQAHYLEQRYADSDFATPSLQAVFEWARGQSETVIATTATRQYPLFGTDLTNRVEFVGVEQPAGGFIRPEDCRQWRQALNRVRPEYVVIAWDRYAPGRSPLPPAAEWTQQSPAVIEEVTFPGAAIYRVRGPLSPAACP